MFDVEHRLSLDANRLALIVKPVSWVIATLDLIPKRDAILATNISVARLIGLSEKRHAFDVFGSVAVNLPARLSTDSRSPLAARSAASGSQRQQFLRFDLARPSGPKPQLNLNCACSRQQELRCEI